MRSRWSSDIGRQFKESVDADDVSTDRLAAGYAM